MIETYSSTFKFQTTDSKNNKVLNNNIISIVDENSKKHFIQYIQYQIVDEERRQRLFTIIGKRCFGSNNNKLDSYLLDDSLDAKEIYKYFDKYKKQNPSRPIVHEVITHNINRYLAYSFSYNKNYFTLMKQTNISNRRVFEKIFLIQMSEYENKRLASSGLDALKIEYIFNAIGKIFFKSQPLMQKSLKSININSEEIIQKTLKYTEGKLNGDSNYLNEELYNRLKNKFEKLENAYFKLYSKAIVFVHEYKNERDMFHLSLALCDYIELIGEETELEEIISFLKTINILIKEGRLSYLIKKEDLDIQNIFLYLLETITTWNSSMRDNIKTFNYATLDLHNALKYFINTYFKVYHDYKCIESKPLQSDDVEEQKSDKISAKEYCSETDIGRDVLDELKELESDVESYVYDKQFDIISITASKEFLRGYIKMLNTLYEFKELAYALSLLKEKLEVVDLKKDTSKIKIFFMSMLQDLAEWRQTVFIEQSIDDIHYIDKSFYANVVQIDLLLPSIYQEEFNNEIDIF